MATTVPSWANMLTSVDFLNIWDSELKLWSGHILLFRLYLPTTDLSWPLIVSYW